MLSVFTGRISRTLCLCFIVGPRFPEMADPWRPAHSIEATSRKSEIRCRFIHYSQIPMLVGLPRFISTVTVSNLRTTSTGNEKWASLHWKQTKERDWAHQSLCPLLGLWRSRTMRELSTHVWTLKQSSLQDMQRSTRSIFTREFELLAPHLQRYWERRVFQERQLYSDRQNPHILFDSDFARGLCCCWFDWSCFLFVF